MWKPNQPGNQSSSSSTEPVRPAVPSTSSSDLTSSRAPGTSSASQAIADQATIGKSLVVKVNSDVLSEEDKKQDAKVRYMPQPLCFSHIAGHASAGPFFSF